MDQVNSEITRLNSRPLQAACGVLVLVGFATFVVLALGGNAGRAWQAYLINFLLFSAIAQGALLFSAIMDTTRARWSGPLASLAEAFAAFFPVSLVLFVLLFAGSGHIFPWLREDLHGKEVWLNLPFLFSRDFVGLLVLYGLGMVYLYHSLWFRVKGDRPGGKLQSMLFGEAAQSPVEIQRHRNRKSVFGKLYMLAFALVLSLIGYDLVMSLEPHWYSTLFGAYWFVKAFYLGLGGIIILAALMQKATADDLGITASHYHDIGKLLFAFCLVWADFFYVQLVVIWYGNLSEEVYYVVQRVMMAPWKHLAWVVFAVCFIIPFCILLNKKVKTKPVFMLGLCSAILVGMWLEHLLLVGPALDRAASTLPLGVTDLLITLGFLALMIQAVLFFIGQFPESVALSREEAG